MTSLRTSAIKVGIRQSSAALDRRRYDFARRLLYKYTKRPVNGLKEDEGMWMTRMMVQELMEVQRYFSGEMES